MTNHESIRTVLDAAAGKLVTIQFLKKDGTARLMQFDPAEKGEIKGTGHVTPDPNIFRVVDSKLGQWRSFDARRCTSIEVDGVKTIMNAEAQ